MTASVLRGENASIRIVRVLGMTLVFLLALAMGGCAHHFSIPPDSQSALYSAQSPEYELAASLAPVFQCLGAEKEWNRIGTPTASRNAKGREKVAVSPEQPTYFVRQTEFTTEKGRYTNLAYRVHFSKIPASLLPFNLTAGKNAGLLAIITLDDKSRPVLVTTVHTCGCYLSIIPTTNLPKDALPPDWRPGAKNVYGETHPALLDYDPGRGERLLLTLRPGVHRVMDASIVSPAFLQEHAPEVVAAGIQPMDALKSLPAEDRPVSFFHEEGWMKGFVKGSVKPWETLLMSWMALDPFVGADKAYDDTSVTGNPFYTSLKPWNRRKSDLWHFERFLRFWGYRL